MPRKDMYRNQKKKPYYRPFKKRAAQLILSQQRRQYTNRGAVGPWFPLRIGGRMGAMHKAEQKFWERDFAATLIVGSATSIGLVNGIPQDTTGSSRIGNQVVMKYFDLRFQVYPPDRLEDDLNSRGPGRLWIWVVLDKQCNGDTPSEADLMTGSFFPNPNNRARFTFLRRYEKFIGAGEVISLPATTPTRTYTGIDDKGSILSFNTRIHLGNKRCFYTGSGSVAANVLSNGIFIFAKYVPEYAAINDGVYIGWQTQLFYTDP